MDSKVIYGYIITTFIAIVLAIMSSFDLFNKKIILNPYIIILIIAILFLFIIMAIQRKTNELNNAIDELNINNKKLNEKLNIYERLNKIEAYLEYEKKFRR